ncbi:hypothetical protein EMPS_02187 [Entomortierella parvispora]|uniref:Uncharacterized protein n=1 Tax=Entomortierella parvispora TaxID=205924 RepID=A0A9P3H4Z0_9FUNG|nr:hypothetical protein EMPS_02187 [Entomortierella parvispora]
MAWTSAPNLFSGNNGRAPSGRIQRGFQQQHDAARLSKLPSQQSSVPSPPPPIVSQPPLVPAAEPKLSLESLSKMSPEEALAAISALVSVSGLSATMDISATATEAAMSTITDSSSVAYTQTKPRQRGKEDSDSRKTEKTAQNGEAWKVIWAVIRYVATGVWRIGLVVYWSLRFLVAKPFHAVMVVMEPPWIMLKDMCKAFLPVYSFFTVAAIIGIVIGGFATWIGQLLISAIGAGAVLEEQPQQHHETTMMQMEQERAMRPQYRMQTRRL